METDSPPPRRRRTKSAEPVDILDVDNLTLEKVAEAIDKTIDRLHILQNLYATLAGLEHRRVTKLVEEYNKAVHEYNKAKLKEEDGDQQHGSTSAAVPALPGDGPVQR